jgi:hypothetical protein
MRLGFMARLRNGYGNIYTPHAGSMIIQVQRETGLANRTIVFTERQVALLRVLGSRVGIIIATLFLGTWLIFAALSIRVPMLSGRIARLEHENRRIDSLQVALSRMNGRYEQVRQLLAATGGGPGRTDVEITRGQPSTPTRPATPNANSTTTPPAVEPPKPDTATTIVR